MLISGFILAVGFGMFPSCDVDELVRLWISVIDELLLSDISQSK